MKLTIPVLAAAASLMVGCANNAQLIAQDGPRYILHIDKFSQSVRADIDGAIYSGKYVKDRAVAYSSSVGLGRPASTATVVQGSDVQAILTAPSGDYIECAIKSSGSTAVGKCVSNKGRQFVLTSN